MTTGLAVFNAGCATVGPDYEKPRPELPHEWHTAARDGLRYGTHDPVQLAHWWTTLNDPILQDLIDRGVTANRDLEKAKARIREARGRRGIAGADLFPRLSSVGSYTTSRTGRDIVSNQDLYTAGFDAAWELDLFGGIRRNVEAAEGDLRVTMENLNAVLVSLSAEVGLNYVDVRTSQTRIVVAEKNLEAQKETYLLTKSRSLVGLGTELATQQAKYNMESTSSEIPTLRAALRESMNRLAILLGKQPGALDDELNGPGPIPAPPPEIAVGIPIDILRVRPDVRAAEKELAARTARVGVAVAELYPKLTLSGSITLDGFTIGSLFAGNPSHSFGPSFSFPIFKAGAIRSNIEVQSALQEQALIEYESTILSALEEVENALGAYSQEQNRRRSLDEAVNAARQAAILAEDQYHAGRTDFSNVLEAQRSLLLFEDKLAQSAGAVTSNLIRLYKAMGGGWDPASKIENIEGREVHGRAAGQHSN